MEGALRMLGGEVGQLCSAGVTLKLWRCGRNSMIQILLEINKLVSLWLIL